MSIIIIIIPSRKLNRGSILLHQREPVLITGCSSGIGRKITEYFADKDVLIYATARKKTDIEDLSKLKNVKAFRLDVTKPKEIQKLCEKIEVERKGLYGLINNAGIVDIWPILATSEATLHKLFNINVYGPHRVTKALIPYIIESKGRIVNIGSISGFQTAFGGGAYSMSKYALEAFSNALMFELKSYGVKVSVIEPTNFKSKIFEKAVPSIRGRKQKVRDKNLYNNDKIYKIFRQEIEAFDVDQFNQQWASLPSPDKVVKACWDALFEEEPKKRYFVTVDPNIFKQGIKSILNIVGQIYRNNEHQITKEDIHDLLESVLDKEEEYLRTAIDLEKLKDE